MEKNNYALVSADEKGTVLALRGCVTSENSYTVEGGMMSLRAAHPAGSLSIDASMLDSINSAGLNVLMRLRKNEESLRIFNVNSEVYDTLRMTGMTGIMKVEKAKSEKGLTQ